MNNWLMGDKEAWDREWRKTQEVIDKQIRKAAKRRAYRARKRDKEASRNE